MLAERRARIAKSGEEGVLYHSESGGTGSLFSPRYPSAQLRSSVWCCRAPGCHQSRSPSFHVLFDPGLDTGDRWLDGGRFMPGKEHWT